MALDILIRLLASGGNQVKAEIQGVANAAKGVDAELKKVGSNAGFQSAEAKAKGFYQAVDAAKEKTQNLTRALDGMRNASLGFAVAGAAGMLLSERMSDAYVEADRLGGKLESMMTGKGLQAGIEQVKTLGNEIAGLTGKDDDQVSAAIAGAIASGRLNGLREFGIVIDATGQAAIEAAGKISEQAKSQEILQQVLRAGGDAAKILRAGLDEGTIALGEMGVRWGNLEEGIGKGSTNVKAALYNGILSPIFEILEASPGLQETVGQIGFIGSAALTTTGSVMGLVFQIIATRAHLVTMGVTGVTSFNAMTVAAGRTALMVGKIVAVALIAAAALYALDKLFHLKEDRELAANIARGDEAGEKLLIIENKKRVKRGQSELTMDEFQGDPDAGLAKNPEANDPTAQIAKLQAQYDSVDKSQVSGADMPDFSKTGAVVVPGAAPVISATKAQKAAESAAKKQATAADKVLKAQDRLEDEIARKKSDIAIAQMEEEYDTRIARLQAGSGNEVLARQLEAEKRLKAAEIRGDGVDVAKIRYQGEMERANITSPTTGGTGNGVADAVAALRAGGGMASLTTPKAGGASAGSTPSGGGTLQVGQPTYRQDSTGVWWAKFPDLRIPPSGLESAFASFAK